jgi:protein SCO1/2
MAQLQSDLASERFRLVSFSVDPERDTPAVLARYADLFHADPARWFFLTGKKPDVYRLVQEGFHLSAIPIDDPPHVEGEVFHDAHFILVDGSAQIRGYYESNDPAALKRLAADAKKLLAGNG